MGVFIDAIKSLSDMKQLANIQDNIEKEIKTLEKEGKLPDELKTAFEELKNAGKNKGDGTVESTVEPLKKFASVLEKYEDLFPKDIKKDVSKFEGVTEDLEGIAGRMDKLNKK